MKGADEGGYRMFPYSFQFFIIGFRKFRITGRIRWHTWIASGAQLTDVGVNVNTCFPRALNISSSTLNHQMENDTIRN